MHWLNFDHISDKIADDIKAVLPHITKADAGLTPNLRALHLAMTTCDLLLSMGVSTSSVVSRALDITETYCELPVHVNITSNLVMFSQLRGLTNEPLTLIRPVAMREVNNMTVQLVQDLVYRIRSGEFELKDAEIEMDKILKHPHTYPGWITPLANATLAAGVALMFTGNWRIILVTFGIVWLVDRLLVYLTRLAVATFFRQAAGGFFVTFAAAIVNQLATNGVGFFAGMNPSLIVVGGIIMLLSGLAIVGAVQDAIDEYYITANARLLKVFIQTSGIVLGIFVGLYTVRQFGMGISVSPDPLLLTGLQLQILAGVVMAAAFAVATQTRLRAIAWAGIIGGMALLVMYVSVHAGIATIPATGIAALIIGILAKLFSRQWHTPSSGIIAAGILPLVPGLSLYTALMQLVNYPPGAPLFYRGISTLFSAIAIALAIAAGTSLGYIIARPLRQRRTHIRNLLPFSNFMWNQLKLPHRHGLARIALGQASDSGKDDDQVDLGSVL